MVLSLRSLRAPTRLNLIYDRFLIRSVAYLELQWPVDTTQIKDRKKFQSLRCLEQLKTKQEGDAVEPFDGETAQPL